MKAVYIFFSLLFFIASAHGQTSSVYGKITDSDTGEELIYAYIILNRNGIFVAKNLTGFEGDFSISTNPGIYEMEITYTGYPKTIIRQINIKPGNKTKLDIQLIQQPNSKTPVVIDYKVPLIKPDNTYNGTLTSEQIKNLPSKNIAALAATKAGLSQVDENDTVTIGNGRTPATNYYINGIRVNTKSNLIPQKETLDSNSVMIPLEDLLGGTSANEDLNKENYKY